METARPAADLRDRADLSDRAVADPEPPAAVESTAVASTPAQPVAQEPPRRAPPQAATQPPVQTAPSVTRSAPALAPARLFINATPWGLLYINDELVGNTPKADLELGPGTYVIRVQRDGFEPFQRQIQVAPGQEVRITDIVLTPRQR